MATKSIKLSPTTTRVIIPILTIICVIVVYFFAKWFFANTIAGHADIKQVADLAVDLAPNDPEAHLSSAILYDKSFLFTDLPKSVAEYEQAVALSPYDFRLWFELGKARERNGDAQGAESALRKSLELAPNYSQVQWTLGNILLREGKSDEAFAQIRQAAEGDRNFANPAIMSAWQIFQGDTAQIKNYVGNSVNLRTAFASVLAKEKRFDEALQIWNSLPEVLKTNDFKATGEEIYQKMTEAKKYRAALQIYSQISDSDDKKFALGKITNGGFEVETAKNPGVFDWQIADGVEPQIGVDDTQKHGGNISLKLIFDNVDGKAFRNISQTIAVESNKRYVFETFYKTELKTSATLRWEIVDASDGKLITATEAIAANTDWANLKAEFFVPETTEAVTVRLVRVNCASALCPISGRVWFDDFSLNLQ
jgi:tetratricopeptide (TPR) repeat protein